MGAQFCERPLINSVSPSVNWTANKSAKLFDFKALTLEYQGSNRLTGLFTPRAYTVKPKGISAHVESAFLATQALEAHRSSKWGGIS
jgi:hypothetical protein